MRPHSLQQDHQSRSAQVETGAAEARVSFGGATAPDLAASGFWKAARLPGSFHGSAATQVRLQWD